MIILKVVNGVGAFYKDFLCRVFINIFYAQCEYVTQLVAFIGKPFLSLQLCSILRVFKSICVEGCWIWTDFLHDFFSM